MPQIEIKPLPPEEAVRFFRGNGFAVSINQHALLAPPDAHGLVASVLASSQASASLSSSECVLRRRLL